VKHDEHKYGLRISYWRNGVACDKANAFVAQVTLSGGSSPTHSFMLPDEAGKLDRLLDVAAHCVAHGVNEAKADIRRVLGVKS
jgi:hypothetical protein